MLTKKSLDILKELFSPVSNLQLPAGVAEQVIEIRTFVEAELLNYPINEQEIIPTT